MEDMGLKLAPVVVRHLSGHLGMFGPIWLALLGFKASPNGVLMEVITLLRLTTFPLTHPTPSHSLSSYNVPLVILQML